MAVLLLQSILNVILLRRTLNCDSDLLDGSFDWGHSMAVLLIDAFSIIILNLALSLAVAFINILLGIPLIVTFNGNTFICGTSWQYFGL